MKHVKKSVLLWYTAPQMYALVVDVEAYPKFLPWCERADVLERTALSMTAKLHVAYAGLHHTFTTRNVHLPDSEVTLSLVDGPFSLLDGDWRFIPIGPQNAACRIEFELRYAFAGRALEVVLSPVFDHIADTFVDRFVKRAEQVYGGD